MDREAEHTHGGGLDRDAPGVVASEPERILGTVEDIVYRSEETHYTVVRVRIVDRDELATLVGNCPAIWVGEEIEAEGKWVQHRKYGTQFQASNITCIAPTTARGIERYLASGVIKGVGKVTAARIVAKFGEDTLRILDKESKRLEEVEGIGEMRRRQIKESWDANRGIREVMIFLQGHGIGTAHATRIYRQYGSQSIAVIKENPYRLCSEVWGIGFKTADRVAMSLGVARDSELRARAGIVHVLETMREEGHCYCTAAELIVSATALLEIPAERLAEALNHDVEQGLLVREDDRVYLTDLRNAEQAVAEKLLRLIRTPRRFRPFETTNAIAHAERVMGLKFAPMQAEALRMALSEKVCVITGGPGVGKTTIIKALVDILARQGVQAHLAAPTGRAAKRMEEATGRQAQTVHRLLKYSPGLGRFEHGADSPIPGDVFILDEVSMMDIPLMQAFLSALPDHACLILVGDVDQLPSVGPGNVLRDIIESGSVPFRKLETIFRQEKGGWIVRNAHHVNRGERLETSPRDEDSDFYFISADDPGRILQIAIELVTVRIPRKFGFDPLNDIQVLTPMRKAVLGTENLNELLQKALNPEGAAIERFGRIYRVGDRVMQIRNNYDKEIFNGDIGRIADVDPEFGALSVDFDGRRVEYSADEADELVHAYACSIHKSQGSEYPAVVIVLTTQHYKLLQRNLLYTAITRGRRLVCLVGQPKAVYMAIRNNEILLRRTTLKERLAAGGVTLQASGKGYAPRRSMPRLQPME